MLYTRTGDAGTSGLFGTRARLPKDHSIYDALGTLDEFNALLGICRIAPFRNRTTACDERTLLYTVQEHLFVIQAELAGAHKTLPRNAVHVLEAHIARLEQGIKSPGGFIVPGTTERAAWYDYARTVARRAERSVIRAKQPVSRTSYAYLNRLSSLLYALARHAASCESAAEPSPSYLHT